VYAVIENPRGSTGRIRYDAATATFAPEPRPFPWPLPVHYGWIPGTLCEADGAELDVLLPDPGHTTPGAVLVGRPIGVLYRSDGDHKIVALRADAGTAYPATTEVAELPELQTQLVQWLHDYRADVQATGWGDAAAARHLILTCQAAWVAERA
jgi:inorganic pyrophosphatase